MRPKLHCTPLGVSSKNHAALRLHLHPALFPLWPPTCASCSAFNIAATTVKCVGVCAHGRELIGHASRCELQTAATCSSPNIIVPVQHV